MTDSLTPGVVGLAPAAAAQAIYAAGLKPTEVERSAVAGIEYPRVIRQYPGTGYPMPAGGVVQYWVSVPLPNPDRRVARPRPEEPVTGRVKILPAPTRKPPVPVTEVAVVDPPLNPERPTGPDTREPADTPAAPPAEPEIATPAPPMEPPVMTAPARTPATVPDETPQPQPAVDPARVLFDFVIAEWAIVVPSAASLMIFLVLLGRFTARRAHGQRNANVRARLVRDRGRQFLVFEEPGRRSLTVSFRPRMDAGTQTVCLRKEAA